MIELFIALFIYALIASKSSAKPIYKAVFAVLLPTLFSVTLEYIYISGNDLPLFQIFMLKDALLFALQTIVAYIVFVLLDQREDSLDSWLLCAVLGGFTIFIITPLVFQTVLPS